MKEKTVFRFFSIADHEKEQEFLRSMHRKGWKFLWVDGLCFFHFAACEPEDVVYQLDYNPEGRAHREEYLQMFRDCGWEYLQDYVGYSYFRKPAAKMNGQEEIFSDGDSRLQMLQRVFRWRVIPLVLLFTAALLPAFWNACAREEWLLAAILGFCILLYLVVFGSFSIAYDRCRRAARR
jgi:hypothetical protein